MCGGFKYIHCLFFLLLLLPYLYLFSSSVVVIIYIPRYFNSRSLFFSLIIALIFIIIEIVSYNTGS